MRYNHLDARNFAAFHGPACALEQKEPKSRNSGNLNLGIPQRSCGREVEGDGLLIRRSRRNQGRFQQFGREIQAESVECRMDFCRVTLCAWLPMDQRGSNG